MDIQPTSPLHSKPAASEGKALKDAAKDLEASFLAEMLKGAGLGKARDFGGGGQGEDQFQSMLVQQQAQALVQNGGIGLAEQLFESLKATQEARK
ncbi:rod-binding protein [Nereida sp. MMG025]|uniref:rod-binding protein n=1 Tax=Nereida sp. MMG025 TaxID=2909981 RepID=UPI001F3D09DC|nr:rod-binding protein [Nereida sp. MMG025]MCF6444692.1 rod-binding protein [Nereida sp. MMG025]